MENQNTEAIKETTKPTIEERVKTIISDLLGADLEDVSNESNLVNDLGADSLDTVEVIMELEKEFNIIIKDDIAENLETVKDHVNIVQTLYAEELEVDLSNTNSDSKD